MRASVTRVATVNGHASVTRNSLAPLVFVVVAACGNEGGRLTLEEGLKCASEAYKAHSGTFSRRGYVIAYSDESASRTANVIVTFDECRRSVSTFFVSAPLGSHEELMGAAQAIKNCVAYGPKARAENDVSAPRA